MGKLRINLIVVKNDVTVILSIRVFHLNTENTLLKCLLYRRHFVVLKSNT